MEAVTYVWWAHITRSERTPLLVGITEHILTLIASSAADLSFDRPLSKHSVAKSIGSLHIILNSMLPSVDARSWLLSATSQIQSLHRNELNDGCKDLARQLKKPHRLNEDEVCNTSLKSSDLRLSHADHSRNSITLFMNLYPGAWTFAGMRCKRDKERCCNHQHGESRHNTEWSPHNRAL